MPRFRLASSNNMPHTLGGRTHLAAHWAAATCVSSRLRWLFQGTSAPLNPKYTPSGSTPWDHDGSGSAAADAIVSAASLSGSPAWALTLTSRVAAHTTSFNEFVHKRQVLCFGDWAGNCPGFARAPRPWSWGSHIYTHTRTQKHTGTHKYTG